MDLIFYSVYSAARPNSTLQKDSGDYYFNSYAHIGKLILTCIILCSYNTTDIHDQMLKVCY
jgi:hypothetical protein